MQPDRDDSYLLDILEEARLLQEFARGMTREAFDTDLKTQRAALYCIQTIGEVARKLSAPFKERHSQIPWRNIIGMRNIIIHQYGEVDLHEVWNVIHKDIPALIAYLAPLVPPDANE